MRMNGCGNMGTDLTTFATGRFPQAVRFVLVNNRVPRAECGGLVEKGYVRDSRTRFIYCDTQCFAGGARMALPIVKNCGRKVS
jgi:hypothetical protein